MGARTSLVVRATEAALRFVAPLSASKETERIVKEAESLRTLAEAWRQSPPALDVRLEVAERAVRVYTAAAWLRRKEKRK